MRARAIAGVVPAFALIVATAAMAAGANVYTVDPKESTVIIHVGKTGALSFVAGHTHEVTGPIARGSVDVDGEDLSRSRVHLVIATSTLQVSARGEPPADVPKVQQTMNGDRVLAIQRYPEVIFDSTGVQISGRQPSAADLLVAGRLTIRGVTKPVTVPVHVTFNGTTLAATGRFSIKQSSYGITPITVAGVVAVKDALEIAFSVRAQR
jgi:polyisoprenoid-binding protein YceI